MPKDLSYSKLICKSIVWGLVIQLFQIIRTPGTDGNGVMSFNGLNAGEFKKNRSCAGWAFCGTRPIGVWEMIKVNLGESIIMEAVFMCTNAAHS